jgi:hypothetical protein
MNVSEMTFGVEFECTLPAGTCPVGAYHAGVQVPDLPPGWKAMRDGSIRAEEAGHQGVEVVSPVLKGEAGLREIQAVCRWLQSKGAKVNRSTGFHVHVGFQGDDVNLQRLASLAACQEEALYAVTGTKARERNHYCKPIKEDRAFKQAFEGSKRPEKGHCRDRYHSLNITNLLSHGKPTVEFRLFAGTTSSLKAISYVRMCLAIVQKAATLKRNPKWNAKYGSALSKRGRSGAGQTALVQFWYAMGWTRGKCPTFFGQLEGEGLPTFDETKRELMRLARKYDGEAAA